ncbi:MAG: DUF4276 family protein [Rhodospirillales bacterium]|nr:DUF4276 family protein [Rhodospirillales bacterium]
MRVDHLEFLVEELSMEAFLGELLPRLLGDRATFHVHVHQGKSDLLHKLESRLRGYAKWIPSTWRIVVVVDRDDDPCEDLKHHLESAATASGLETRTSAGAPTWQVVNRIAIEELEAWYFGDWAAVREAYPKVPTTIPNQAKYRLPDAIAGGTWEALERILQRAGYFSGGLQKVEMARQVGKAINPTMNRSPSFNVFQNAVIEAIT